jgi:hypothetical protein
MAFVLLGQHRSGTSFVNSLVREHPLVESINEPFSQHLRLFRQTELQEWSADDLTPERLHPAIKPGGECEQYILELKRWMCAPLPGVRGFKETGLTEKADWLRAALGDFPTAVVVRDPRAVVASVLRRGLQDSWWSYRSRLERFAAGSALLDACRLTEPVDVVAAVWTLRADRLLALAKRHGWLIVRLEDLIARPTDELERLMTMLGLEVDRRQLDFLAEAWSDTFDGTYSYRRRADAVLHTWKEVLDGDAQRAVESIARAPMRELGYEAGVRELAVQ